MKDDLLIYTNQDIAVVGAGVVTPVGIKVIDFNSALKEGKRKISFLKGVPIPRNKDAVGQISEPYFSFPNKAARMALHAIRESLLENEINVSGHDDVALFVASIGGDSKAAEDCYLDLLHPDISNWKLRKLLMLYPNDSITSFLSKKLQLKNSRIVISNACASGNIALGLAMDYLRLQQCKLAIVVGVENCKLSMIWGAERSGFIGRDLRPFHKDRDGTILGEGAGAVILTLASEAKDKKILGYLQGFGCVCDKGAEAITLAQDGNGLYRSMSLALKESGKTAEQVEYVNAHAPGTPLIDLIECKAIVNLGISLKTPVNSTKSLTTHLSGASPIVELVATLLQFKEGYLHPNFGLNDGMDVRLPISPIGSTVIFKKVSFGLSNACGGGGLNTSIAVSSKANDSKFFFKRKINSNLVVTGLGGLSEDRLNWSILGNDLLSCSSPIAVLSQPFDIYDYYPRETNYHFMNKAAQIGAAIGSLTFSSISVTADEASLPYQKDKIAVIAGTYLGGAPEASQVMCDGLATKPEWITPNMALDHGVHLGATLICRYYGLIGASYTLTGSLSAGLQALSAASVTLFSQRAKAALVLGFDTNFELQRRLLNRILPSTSPSVDFTSSGAGIILEQEEAAKSRGAFPLAYIRHPIILSEAKYDKGNTLISSFFKKIKTCLWSNIYLGTDYSPRLLEFAENINAITKNNATIFYLGKNCRKTLAGSSFIALVAAIKKPSPSLVLSLDRQGFLIFTIVEPFIL